MSQETASSKETGQQTCGAQNYSLARVRCRQVSRPLHPLPWPPLTKLLTPSTFLCPNNEALEGPGLEDRAVPYTKEPV